MKIIDNYCLKNNNTFKVNVQAKKFVEYYNDDDIIEYIRKHPEILDFNYLVIGEGSNLLFCTDYDGVIIHPATKEIRIISEDDSHYYVKASAGVIFCDFIDWAINNNAFGIENLSYIPGTVGASAVQNVGAYGVEAGDFIYEVEFYNTETNRIEKLNQKQCKYGYRDSIFKKELKNKTIILSVTYCLNKEFLPNLSYIDVKKYFSDNSEIELNARNIRNAVIEIRGNKLPDPKHIGNAGSFFKNPIINKSEFEILRYKFPEIKFYEHEGDKIKLAAGWLIDQCGFKGFEYKGAAVHDKQALVIINKSNSTGKDIMELSQIIIKKVLDKYDILLEPEVMIINTI